MGFFYLLGCASSAFSDASSAGAHLCLFLRSSLCSPILVGMTERSKHLCKAMGFTQLFMGGSRRMMSPNTHHFQLAKLSSLSVS